MIAAIEIKSDIAPCVENCKVYLIQWISKGMLEDSDPYEIFPHGLFDSFVLGSVGKISIHSSLLERMPCFSYAKQQQKNRSILYSSEDSMTFQTCVFPIPVF